MILKIVSSRIRTVIRAFGEPWGTRLGVGESVDQDRIAIETW